MDEYLYSHGVGLETVYWSVSELNARVKSALALDFDDVALRGEVSGVSKPRSGHIYFKLKDEKAQVSAVLWKSVAGRLVFDLEDGLAVRVRGEATLYETRGDFQVVVRKIEPEGVGGSNWRFDNSLNAWRLKVFSTPRKRPLPKFPQRLALITSPTGAAVQDFLRVAGNRWPATEILVVPVRVQGQARRLKSPSRSRLRIEFAALMSLCLCAAAVVLKTCGLLMKKSSCAIFASRVPVVSGVGHEVDVTIADLVADVRALTPTDAANQTLPDARISRKTRLFTRSPGGARSKRTSIAPRKPWPSLADRSRTIDRDLERRRDRLDQLSGRLAALNPLSVLVRGYGITLLLDGATVVRSAVDLQVGDLVQTRLAQGRFLSRVETIET